MLTREKIELDEVRKWPVEIGYFLQSNNGSVGFFPAIFTGTQRMVVVLDLKLIFDVWRRLEPRLSEMHQYLFFVDKEYGIAYPVQQAQHWIEVTDQSPIQILTQKEFDNLIAENSESFSWMPGVIGGTITEEKFRQKIGLIEDAATDPRL